MLAIAGGKGGCGKTTTALGVARALAARESPVFVADGDRDAPNLPVAADVPADPTIADVGPGRPAAAVAGSPPALPGVRVLPAPLDAADARFVSLLSTVEPPESPLLVDCPAGAGPDAAAPLRAADATLLVTTATPQSLRDAAKTAAMARELDAPPVAAAVVKSESVPAGAAALLDLRDLVAVPAAADPLSAAPTRAAYERLAQSAAHACGDGATCETPSNPDRMRPERT